MTTNTLENATAAPAMSGFNSPAAASGSAATLQAKAQNRFALIVRSVVRDRRMASASLRRSPRGGEVSRLDGDVGAGAHREPKIRLRGGRPHR